MKADLKAEHVDKVSSYMEMGITLPPALSGKSLTAKSNLSECVAQELRQD